MSTSKLTLEQWTKILDFLKEETNVYVKSEQVSGTVEDACDRMWEVVQRVQALCQME